MPIKLARGVPAPALYIGLFVLFVVSGGARFHHFSEGSVAGHGRLSLGLSYFIHFFHCCLFHLQAVPKPRFCHLREDICRSARSRCAPATHLAKKSTTSSPSVTQPHGSNSCNLPRFFLNFEAHSLSLDVIICAY